MKKLLLLLTLCLPITASAYWYVIKNGEGVCDVANFETSKTAALAYKKPYDLIKTNTLFKAYLQNVSAKCRLVTQTTPPPVVVIPPPVVVVPPPVVVIPPPIVPPPPVVIVPPATLMPFVDVSKNIPQAVGFSTLRIQPTSQQPNSSDIGAFRVVCAPSHMSNDDPMVFPNQQGATHHHTFYGNTSVKYNSDLMNLSDVGNSTCNGGTMNKSGYWHPSVINTETNTAILPDGGAIFYYKTGYRGVKPSDVKTPPKGLRILAGNPKAVNASQSRATHYKCRDNGYVSYKTIPNCGVGDAVQFIVDFPQCWDGKNLDSPNHQDHMAYASNGCPSSHPVAIPEISLNMNFKITTANQSTKWRLSSDNYAFDGKNAGYSGHADWVNGWHQPTLEGIVRNCLNASKDCHAHLLGDGRMFE